MLGRLLRWLSGPKGSGCYLCDRRLFHSDGKHYKTRAEVVEALSG